ncbi:hypothetical protein [Salinigranum sp. GCM10025319]|uniref:hypothetical protein n=1 Tax=Salinigranum sp. GCM10025319 TaxID=3252687 RepID=UPI0036079B2A
MVASSAFRELSEVLARLESTGADVRHAAVAQEFAAGDENEDTTANLTVALPLLADVDTGERVSVAADTATVDGDALAVDLTVTVSAGDEGEERADAPVDTSDDADFDTPSGARTLPAYKDPDALRAVYERYETFPEMTDALGVDVTSETVRRHMVKHDVHDPTDSTPTPYSTVTTREQSSVEPEVPGDTVDADTGEGPTSECPTSPGGDERPGRYRRDDDSRIPGPHC